MITKEQKEEYVDFAHKRKWEYLYEARIIINHLLDAISYLENEVMELNSSMMLSTEKNMSLELDVEFCLKEIEKLRLNSLGDDQNEPFKGAYERRKK